MKENKQLTQILFECAIACRLCAEACIKRNDIELLQRCIHLNVDCAELCTITINFLIRNSEILDDQLDVCAELCALCAEESNRHYSQVPECRQSAELCALAEEACHLHV